MPLQQSLRLLATYLFQRVLSPEGGITLSKLYQKPPWKCGACIPLISVNNYYPGAFYPQVRYVCVAGKAVFGRRQRGQWLAYSSYQLTCGQGNCWGDGITPIAAAHLQGADNLILDGVWHSPRSPGRWYGSPEVVPLLADYLH